MANKTSQQVLPPEAIAQIKDFQNFINASPTSYHAAAELATRLKKSGYNEIKTTDSWQMNPGKYFLHNDGAVAAWQIPKALSPHHKKLAEKKASFRILAAHTDSPALKLKPKPDSQHHGWGQIGVEIYGSPIWNSWLDRDLGLAGRLIDNNANTHLVKTEAILRIPQLAPHLDRTLNPNGLKLDPQKHLRPLWYSQKISGNSHHILDYLAQIAGLKNAKNILGFDIFTYDTQTPTLVGLEKQFLASPRLDNLSSVHPILLTLIDEKNRSTNNTTIKMAVFFDHEEVGSATPTGADSPFLPQILQRIAYSLGANSEGYQRIRARSSLISVDAGHLINPNYAEKYDPDAPPEAGNGPLLKLNAQAHYTSDAKSSALWVKAAAKAKIPSQFFVSNNAVPCGSTIGPISVSQLGIQTADIGIGLLSMHSIREMCAPIDLWYLKRALSTYLNT